MVSARIWEAWLRFAAACCGFCRIVGKQEVGRSTTQLLINRRVTQEALPVHRRNSNLPDSGRVTVNPEN
jgi:hypothetical protein